MRVAVVYPYLHQRGGIERYVWKLAAELGREHHVTVVTGRADGPLPPGCRVVSLPFIPRPRFLAPFTFALAATLWLRRASFDVIHAHAASTFQQDVVTAHSCHRAWFRRSLGWLPRWTREWWLKVLNPFHHLTILTEHAQYRRGAFAHVVAVSRSVADELAEHYAVPGGGVSVVRGGVDLEEFSPARRSAERAEVRRERGINDDELLLLFVGNEFRRKGLSVLIRALAGGPPRAKLLVAGRDNPRSFAALARRLGVGERVVFTGAISDVGRLCAGADAFVLPTRYEPFGLVLLEAMASGLPVVTTRLAGAAEIMEDGVSAILIDDPVDERAWRAAVERLASAPLRAALGEAARTRAEQHSWRTVANGTLRAFHAALEARGSGARRLGDASGSGVR